MGRIHLLLPGLLQLPEEVPLAARLPALETWLARADRETESADPLAAAFQCFGVSAADGADLPVAAVSYLGDSGELPPGPCLRADPVHLLPDRDQLLLFDSSGLQLATEEAAQLVAELNALYAADGWRFEAPAPDRWYLHLPAAPRLRCTPLPAVSGQPIGRSLPTGEDARVWHAVMNEMQMLLHSSQVNVLREDAGRPTVNGVWFWGGGAAPALTESHWSGVWSGDVLLRGLARLSGVEPGQVPTKAEGWLGSLPPGDQLLELTTLAEATQSQGKTGWEQALRDVEKQWAAPLLAALRAGRFAEIGLHTGDGRVYLLRRAHLRRWWRLRRPLSQFKIGSSEQGL